MKRSKKCIQLPYHYIIQPIDDESGKYFYARIKEFEGCQATGDTFQEAYENIQIKMKEWIKEKIDNGLKIPDPCVESEDEYDIRCYERAIEEFSRNPKTYTLEEVEKTIKKCNINDTKM